MTMKQALKLKKWLPDRHWRRLSSAAQRFVGIAIQPVVLLAKALPDMVLIEMRERLGMVRRMNYDRHDIRLVVDSLTEYSTRLHSCKKEPDAVEWIETFFRDGDVLYDVGAAVGSY